MQCNEYLPSCHHITTLLFMPTFLAALEVVQRRFRISQSMIFTGLKATIPPWLQNQAGWNRPQPLSSSPLWGKSMHFLVGELNHVVQAANHTVPTCNSTISNAKSKMRYAACFYMALICDALQIFVSHQHPRTGCVKTPLLLLLLQMWSFAIYHPSSRAVPVQFYTCICSLFNMLFVLLQVWTTLEC